MTNEPGDAIADDELLATAERVIGAASAALLWVGADEHGVLAHVASLSAERMAGDRRMYWLLRQADSAVLAHVITTCCEPAALPSEAAPAAWTARVDAARSDAYADMAGWDVGDPRGIVVPNPDVAMQVRAVHGVLRQSALQCIRLWGTDPIPVPVIRTWAHHVDVAAQPPKVFF